jgi:hypothetical protein
MLKISSDVWGLFKLVEKHWRPKRLDVLTGFLGAGAANVIEHLSVTPRIVVGLAAGHVALPQAQIEEIKRLQSIGDVCYFPGLHAKLYLFDDNVVVVGSANLTKPGFETLQELVVLTDNARIVSDSRRIFERTWSEAKQIHPARLRSLKGGTGSIAEGPTLGVARRAGDTPFSHTIAARGSRRSKTAARSGAERSVRLCAYYPEHIETLDSEDPVVWSTSETTKAGDLQLFCITKDGSEPDTRGVDAAHSLWRATDRPHTDRRRSRWKVQGPFELVVRFDNPVPKAAFVQANLIKYERWPQSYRGKKVADLKRLAKTLIAYNPRQRGKIRRGLRLSD